MDNSIRLKEFRVVSGALRKRDKELGIFFLFFQKGFCLGEEGRMG